MCFEIRDIQCIYLCACVCMCMSMCMCVRLVKVEGGIYLFRDFGAVNTGACYMYAVDCKYIYVCLRSLLQSIKVGAGWGCFLIIEE